MKFKLLIVLAITLSFTSTGFSQTTDDEPASSITTLQSSSLLRWLDSLSHDPGFQEKVKGFAENVFFLAGPTPASIIDTPLPDFSLEDLDGNLISKDHLLGKAVFLHIWHPDAVENPGEIDQLNQLAKAYQGKGITFLSLTPLQPEYLKYFLQRHPLHFRHVPNAFSLINQITVLPQNILVDYNGIIRYITTDPIKDMFEPKPIDWSAVRLQIDSLLTK